MHVLFTCMYEEDPSKMKVLEWPEQFSHYKYVGLTNCTSLTNMINPTNRTFTVDSHKLGQSIQFFSKLHYAIFSAMTMVKEWHTKLTRLLVEIYWGRDGNTLASDAK